MPHINVNILNAGTGGPAGFGIDHYTSIARKAERAELDAVFLPDGPSLVLDPAEAFAAQFVPTPFPEEPDPADREEN